VQSRGRSVNGSLTGTPIDSEDTLGFRVLQNVRADGRDIFFEKAADAFARMMQGKRVRVAHHHPDSPRAKRRSAPTYTMCFGFAA
jgi:D-arabinose 1-dehydrogenase-like Zn-dependent alcohol dehydrogenase